MSAKVADKNQMHKLSMEFHDPRLRHAWRKFYHDAYQRLGSELKFSPGFWTDLWASLSLDYKIPSLLVIYLGFEVMFVFSFGALLFATSGITPRSFSRSVLASARVVTMLANFESNNFHYINNGGDDEQISVVGSMILVLEGYVHFMFVCIASSLIIVRALRPLQQVAFSHHAVLTDTELVLRIRILRPKTTVLIHPTVQVDVCLTSGTFLPLPLVGNGTYAKWSGNPTITIRHKIDEESPLFLERGPPKLVKNEVDGTSQEQPGDVRSTTSNIVHVSCALIATDTNGTPINEVQTYVVNTGFNAMLYAHYFEASDFFPPYNNIQACPQVVTNAKFQDQIRFGTATPEELANNHDSWFHPHESTSNLILRKKGGSGEVINGAKRLVTNSDTFCRIADEASEIGMKSSSASTVAGEAAARTEAKFVRRKSDPNIK
ncbi:hypothetical protein TrVE_jg10700 [Triparma verrucosa]|uniref:Inward rectifier potassium channel C-terminal domain-containing protein n=2 Tax=Triparma TaxID=722752 RepID=A0A9W7BTR0_9STRA|nr:hypothetical protein TrVE_jg10700 [Triparma verrucosa]GMH96524.1 hypothetical protein TrST_g12607 [Triparma strigata]